MGHGKIDFKRVCKKSGKKEYTGINKLNVQYGGNLSTKVIYQCQICRYYYDDEAIKEWQNITEREMQGIKFAIVMPKIFKEIF